MVYSFFKWVVQLLTRLFYKSHHVNGLENIPKDGPLLIAMNHPAGFMEPIILASTFPRKLYFLVRGDIFKKAWLKPMLDATNQLPIYRFKDGYKNLKKNQKVLNAVNSKLHDGKPILIYVEGSTKSVMQLRPLQKGMARMAFDAIESKEDLNLQILPVGINFTDPTKLYSEVMLNIGKPFPVSDYVEEFKAHPNQGYTALTKATKKSLHELVLHVDNLEETPLYEDVLSLYRSTLPHEYLPRKRISTQRYLKEKSIVDGLNSQNDDQKSKLAEDIKSLKSSLNRQMLDLKDLQNTPKSISYLVILLLGFPFALIGLLINAPFLYLAKNIAEKNVKPGAFRISVIAAIITMASIFYYALIFIITSIVFSWKGAIITVLGILLGCFAHFYFYMQNKMKRATKHIKVTAEQKLERDRILQSVF